jgi:uncharacterized protein with FMN-binding domain
VGWIIALIIVAAAVLTGAIMCNTFNKEHEEARNLPLNAVDFSRLKDGVYTGEYGGGMYKWRENSVRVTVAGGKVTHIELLKNKENQKPEFTNELYNRVMNAQSLQVDAISGATLISIPLVTSPLKS